MAGHGLQYNLSFDGSSPQQPLYNVTHQSVIFKTFSKHVVILLFQDVAMAIVFPLKNSF